MKVGSLAECHVDMSRPNKRLTSHLLRRTNCVRTSLTPVKCKKTLSLRMHLLRPAKRRIEKYKPSPTPP